MPYAYSFGYRAFLLEVFVASNDVKIKDLIIKVKAGDIESAAKSADKLSNALGDAAAGGELVDASISKLPLTLRNALNVANELKKVMSSKLGTSLVGQFGGVNSELKSVMIQLQTINKLASGSITFKGLGTSSTTAKKLADNLLESATAAEMLENKLGGVALQLLDVNEQAAKLSTSMAGSSMADFDKINNQLVRLNDTLELVLGEIAMMGDAMSHSASIITDKLGDIASGTELVRRSSKQTTAAVGDLGESFDKAANKTEKANRGLGNSKNHAQGAGREFSKLARVGGSVSMAYAMIAANVFALSEAWSYVARGDALTRMEKASNALAGTTGQITNDMTDMIQQVSGFSVDYETAMRTAAAATIYGFDTKTVEDFTKIARGASQVLGGDMTDFMNRLVKGTAKQERELLDELGILVRVDAAQQEYAASLGKTANELTSFEKGQAFANAVAKEGIEKYGKLGDTLSNTSPMEKATARIKELSRSFSQMLASVANPIIVTIVEKRVSEKEGSKAAKAETARASALAEAQKQIVSEKPIQALSLWSKALDEQNILLESGKKEIAAYAKEQDTLSTGMWHVGKTADMVSKQVASEQRAFDAKELAAFDEATRNVAMTLGLTRAELEQMSSAADSIKLNANLMNAEQTAKNVAKEIDALNTTLKIAPTTAGNMANQFKNAQKAVENLEKMLESKVAKSIPAVAQQLRRMIDSILLSTAQGSKAQLDQAASIYRERSDFEKAAIDRGNVLDDLAGRSLDNNINSVAVNKQKLADLAKEQTLLEMSLLSNEKDELAQQRIKEIQGERSQIMKDQMDLNYSMAQQAIDNENSIRTATIMLQDQTDATKNRLEAEQALVTAKKKAALAGTAADSASAINERAQAEVALKDAIIEEAVAKDQLVSKEKILLGYQKDTEAYLKGHISYQADIISAEEDLRQATSELAILQGAGLKYEERRLELMQQQAQAQRAISEAKAKEITERVAASQIGGSRADSGGVSAELRAQEEARAKVQALYADESARYTTEYRDAVNELTQATYEYVTALQAKNREEVNNVFDAMGSSQISSTEGLVGQDLTDTLRADALANYTTALDTIASYNPAMTDMITNMGQLTNSFIAFGKGAVNASQLVAPVLNTLSSAMTAASQGAIDDIQNQIDMEKKADGQSEKSKAKIAKLEAEKAAKQKEQAIQTITVQTAVGMAQALGAAPPPYNFVLMGAVAAAGLMALKQAQSGNAIASSAATASPESLTLGERSNRVDTSLAATAGESAYIRGDQGTGSIQKFTPRASGGKAYAGTTILAGENGPEPITLDSDATVTSNSSASKGRNKFGNVSLSINAVDARSFRDLLATDPGFITSLVESSLNEKGLTLG